MWDRMHCGFFVLLLIFVAASASGSEKDCKSCAECHLKVNAEFFVDEGLSGSKGYIDSNGRRVTEWFQDMYGSAIKKKRSIRPEGRYRRAPREFEAKIYLALFDNRCNPLFINEELPLESGSNVSSLGVALAAYSRLLPVGGFMAASVYGLFFEGFQYAYNLTETDTISLENLGIDINYLTDERKRSADSTSMGGEQDWGGRVLSFVARRGSPELSRWLINTEEAMEESSNPGTTNPFELSFKMTLPNHHTFDYPIIAPLSPDSSFKSEPTYYVENFLFNTTVIDTSNGIPPYNVVYGWEYLTYDRSQGEKVTVALYHSDLDLLGPLDWGLMTMIPTSDLVLYGGPPGEVTYRCLQEPIAIKRPAFYGTLRDEDHSTPVIKMATRLDAHDRNMVDDPYPCAHGVGHDASMVIYDYNHNSIENFTSSEGVGTWNELMMDFGLRPILEKLTYMCRCSTEEDCGEGMICECDSCICADNHEYIRRLDKCVHSVPERKIEEDPFVALVNASSQQAGTSINTSGKKDWKSGNDDCFITEDGDENPSFRIVFNELVNMEAVAITTPEPLDPAAKWSNSSDSGLLTEIENDVQDKEVTEITIYGPWPWGVYANEDCYEDSDFKILNVNMSDEEQEFSDFGTVAVPKSICRLEYVGHIYSKSTNECVKMGKTECVTFYFGKSGNADTYNIRKLETNAALKLDNMKLNTKARLDPGVSTTFKLVNCSYPSTVISREEYFEYGGCISPTQSHAVTLKLPEAVLSPYTGRNGETYVKPLIKSYYPRWQYELVDQSSPEFTLSDPTLQTCIEDSRPSLDTTMYMEHREGGVISVGGYTQPSGLEGSHSDVWSGYMRYTEPGLKNFHIEMLTMSEEPTREELNNQFNITQTRSCHYERGAASPGNRIVYACDQGATGNVLSIRLDKSTWNYTTHVSICHIQAMHKIGSKLGDHCEKDEDCESWNSECKSGKCSCRPGYEKEILSREFSICRDVNECELGECDPSRSLNRRELNSTCVNTLGSYECICEDMYTLNNSTLICEDMRHGDEFTCPCEQNCEDKVTHQDGVSFECSCDDGFQLSKNLISCLDEDECENGTTCAGSLSNPRSGAQIIRGKCVNSYGSYKCVCDDGYYWEDNKGCIDKRECETAMGNHCEQICINNFGKYECQCRPGYTLHNHFFCNDTNECALTPEYCDKSEDKNGNVDGICVNTVGSFKCTCPAGYRYDSFSLACVDIDECRTEKPCEDQCTNHVVSQSNKKFECSCAEGLRLSNNSRTCVDVNECEQNRYMCKQGSTNDPDGLASRQQGKCENFYGGYRCRCHDNYKWDEENNFCEATKMCLDNMCGSVTLKMCLEMAWAPIEIRKGELSKQLNRNILKELNYELGKFADTLLPLGVYDMEVTRLVECDKGDVGLHIVTHTNQRASEQTGERIRRTLTQAIKDSPKGTEIEVLGDYKRILYLPEVVKENEHSEVCRRFNMEDVCANGGACQVVNEKPKCFCTPSWGGLYCRHRRSRAEDSSSEESHYDIDTSKPPTWSDLLDLPELSDRDVILICMGVAVGVLLLGMIIYMCCRAATKTSRPVKTVAHSYPSTAVNARLLTSEYGAQPYAQVVSDPRSVVPYSAPVTHQNQYYYQ